MTARKKGELMFCALEFAARAHHGQYRKGTELPYLLHPLMAARILIEAGCDEEVVAAGILHDTVEDAGVSMDQIRSEFGERVARLIAGASEPDKSASWEERKQQTLDRIKSAALDELLVEAADKLDNIRAIGDDLERLGERVWERFNRDRESQAWYYRGLARAFLDRAAPEPAATLFKRFAKEVERVFKTEEANAFPGGRRS